MADCTIKDACRHTYGSVVTENLQSAITGIMKWSLFIWIRENWTLMQYGHMYSVKRKGHDCRSHACIYENRAGYCDMGGKGIFEKHTELSWIQKKD